MKKSLYEIIVNTLRYTDLPNEMCEKLADTICCEFYDEIAVMQSPDDIVKSVGMDIFNATMQAEAESLRRELDTFYTAD